MQVSPAGARKPRPGVDAWTNPGNGFRCVQLHFTADPEKRDPSWKTKTARNMHPRAWRREYEIDWAAPEGEPVVPEYEESIHCRDIVVDRSLRLLRFWDFGFDSPVVLFAQLTLWDQLRVMRELCPFNITLRQLIPAAEATAKELLGLDAYLAGDRAIDWAGMRDDADADNDESARWRFPTHAPGQPPPTPTMPERRVFDAGDPEGISRKSLGVEAQVMAQHGLRLHVTRPGTKESYQNLRDRLLRTVMVPGIGRQPAAIIAPECRMLRQALGGAFCRGVLPPYRPKPAHPWKDLVDALRYGIDNIDQLRHGADRQLATLATRDIVETRT